MNLRVLYRDEHYIAIAKPAGMPVHRSREVGPGPVVLQTLRDQIGQYVYPIHRLDRGTSGVLLFGLSSEAARAMGAQFQSHTATKVYRGLVRGWPAEQGVLDRPLRDPDPPHAIQESLTEFRRLARYELPLAVPPFATSRYALVEFRPKTGRRHQIRRHCNHAGHPLLGDATHGKGINNRTLAEFLGITRMWLQAVRLEVDHPFSGERLCLAVGDEADWVFLENRLRRYQI